MIEWKFVRHFFAYHKAPFPVPVLEKNKVIIPFRKEKDLWTHDLLWIAGHYQTSKSATPIRIPEIYPFRKTIRECLESKERDWMVQLRANPCSKVNSYVLRVSSSRVTMEVDRAA